MTTDDQLRQLAARSAEVIAEHQDAGGAYLASPAFPVYRFSWLRDGAFIADAMSRADRSIPGAADSAERFFGWCGRTLGARTAQIDGLIERSQAGEVIERHEHPPTRFTADGADSGEEWWDFQLDGYGTWMWALGAHRARTEAATPPTTEVAAAVALSVRYLAAFWREPCFDWWEEHADGVHTSTLASIAAGLRAAADLAVTGETVELATTTATEVEAFVAARCIVDGMLVKQLDGDTADTRVDASLLAALTPFATVDPTGTVGEATYRRIAAELAPDGVHRYVGDTYFGGGRWIVLAGFAGWHEAVTGRRAAARARLEWMHAQATGDGQLPEQVCHDVFDPSFVEIWTAKWGPVATPLLWSHAMYITLASELGLLP